MFVIKYYFHRMQKKILSKLQGIQNTSINFSKSDEQKEMQINIEVLLIRYFKLLQTLPFVNMFEILRDFLSFLSFNDRF